jgi:hypothetical protein
MQFASSYAAGWQIYACMHRQVEMPKELVVSSEWAIANNWCDEQALLVSPAGHTKIPLFGLLPAAFKDSLRNREATKQKLVRLREESRVESMSGSGASSASSEKALDPTPDKKQRVRA